MRKCKGCAVPINSKIKCFACREAGRKIDRVNQQIKRGISYKRKLKGLQNCKVCKKYFDDKYFKFFANQKQKTCITCYRKKRRQSQGQSQMKYTIKWYPMPGIPYKGKQMLFDYHKAIHTNWNFR